VKYRYFFRGTAASLTAPVLLFLLCIFPTYVLVLETTESGSPYHFISGERIVYHLNYKSRSSYDFRAVFGGESSKQAGTPLGFANSFETYVRGSLSMTVLERNENGALINFSIKDPAVTLVAEGQETPEQAETIKKALGKNIFAQVSGQGRIVSIELDPLMNTLSQSYARAVLALTQFIFPEGPMPRSGQWESREEDPSGRYIAGYALDKDAGNKADGASLRTFVKTKRRYLQAREKPGVGAIEVSTIIVPRGVFTARFNFSEGFLFSLHGAESQDILVNKIKVGHARNAIDLSFVRREAQDETALSSLKNELLARQKIAMPTPLYVKPSMEETRAAIEKNQLGDSTLKSLLAELKAAEAVQDSRYSSTPLFLKYKALIYLHPESCESLGKVLSSAASGSKTMHILAMALSAVAHAEAQAALVSAIRAHSQDKPALYELLPSLGTVEQSTPSAEDALRALAFNSQEPEIASAARLSLGAQARRLAEKSPERAQKIVESFIEKIESLSSPELIRQLLLALGNAGSARALPTIAKFAGSSSPDLRAVAVRALRFVDSSKADELLLRAIVSDRESSVRLEAAYALGFREMTQASYNTQKDVFKRDPDVSLRLAVLKNLWKAHETYPEVKRLVKQSAEKDPSKEVQKAAAEIIAQDQIIKPF